MNDIKKHGIWKRQLENPRGILTIVHCLFKLNTVCHGVINTYVQISLWLDPKNYRMVNAYSTLSDDDDGLWWSGTASLSLLKPHTYTTTRVYRERQHCHRGPRFEELIVAHG